MSSDSRRPSRRRRRDVGSPVSDSDSVERKSGSRSGTTTVEATFAISHETTQREQE